jgi:CheY-like chemotaxis protein
MASEILLGAASSVFAATIWRSCRTFVGQHEARLRRLVAVLCRHFLDSSDFSSLDRSRRRFEQQCRPGGVAILIVEDEPLIALDLQATLQAAGASVTCCKADDAVARLGQHTFSAAVLDARPAPANTARSPGDFAMAGLPFLFYSTQAPDDVTTIRGAPVVLKPGRPQDIIAAVALLLGRNLRP